jgi:hypothetical protein
MRMQVISLFGLGMAMTAAGVAVAERPGCAPRVDPGSWVSLNLVVDGQTMPLYADPGGTARRYVEARKNGRYELHLANLTGERLGVSLTVDGLNVISGERQEAGPGRMYVLGPWENTSIRGWRTSLEEICGFTFVDERASYAARSGNANGKMGWIEMAVYRDRDRGRARSQEGKLSQGRGADRRDAGPAADEARPEARSKNEESERRSNAPAPAAGSSYPGTGWGDRMDDRVQLVEYDAETTPAERVTIRYEYRAALAALGIVPAYARLDERERGEGGFAKSPRF